MTRKTRFLSIPLALTLLTFTATGAFAGHHEEKAADIVDTAVAAGSFETLVAAVKAAGLVDALKGDGPFTVFAPTDDAFARLPAGTVESLLEPGNVDRLRAILTYHVVSGEVSARQAAGLDQAETLNGQQVAIKIEDGRLKIDDATVITNDVDAANGVIHVIDRVLLPEEAPRVSALGPRELIQLAISRGAPLYNHGQQEACAAIYEVTAQSLLNGFANELADASRDRLRTALGEIQTTHSANRRAWILRDALDEVYGSMPSTQARR